MKTHSGLSFVLLLGIANEKHTMKKKYRIYIALNVVFWSIILPVFYVPPMIRYGNGKVMYGVFALFVISYLITVGGVNIFIARMSRKDPPGP